MFDAGLTKHMRVHYFWAIKHSTAGLGYRLQSISYLPSKGFIAF